MTEGAAGMDLISANDVDMVIEANQVSLIPTGLQVEIPPGFEWQIRPRSGLALKNQITVLNSPGTIDSDYRGEVKVILANLGKTPFVIKPQSRVAQAVLCPVIRANIVVVESLGESTRGIGGFGSTGI